MHTCHFQKQLSFSIFLQVQHQKKECKSCFMIAAVQSIRNEKTTDRQTDRQKDVVNVISRNFSVSYSFQQNRFAYEIVQ